MDQFCIFFWEDSLSPRHKDILREGQDTKVRALNFEKSFSSGRDMEF